MTTIMDGVIIGATGGGFAGVMVYSVQYLHGKAADIIEGRRILNWFKKNTSDERGKEFRTTRAIASWNNLTEDRVRYLCSKHGSIYLSTGVKEDVWSLYARSSSPSVR